MDRMDKMDMMDWMKGVVWGVPTVICVALWVLLASLALGERGAVAASTWVVDERTMGDWLDNNGNHERFRAWAAVQLDEGQLRGLEALMVEASDAEKMRRLDEVIARVRGLGYGEKDKVLEELVKERGRFEVQIEVKGGVVFEEVVRRK